MKITLEIPDTTACAIFNYVYMTNTGMSMGSCSIDTDRLHGNAVISVNPPMTGEDDHTVGSNKMVDGGGSNA